MTILISALASKVIQSCRYLSKEVPLTPAVFNDCIRLYKNTYNLNRIEVEALIRSTLPVFISLNKSVKVGETKTIKKKIGS